MQQISEFIESSDNKLNQKRVEIIEIYKSNVLTEGMRTQDH